jgi:uncharacterized coiled-coil DUF342 family protein
MTTHHRKADEAREHLEALRAEREHILAEAVRLERTLSDYRQRLNELAPVYGPKSGEIGEAEAVLERAESARGAEVAASGVGDVAGDAGGPL